MNWHEKFTVRKDKEKIRWRDVHKKQKTGHNTVIEIDESEEEEGENEASTVLVNDESFDESCEEYSSSESEESDESELSSSSSDNDE